MGPLSLRRRPRPLRALLGPMVALPHWRPHSWPATTMLQTKGDISKEFRHAYQMC
jgi:hypothetical protein